MAPYELPTAITTRSSEMEGSSGFLSIEDTPSTISKSFTVHSGEAEAAMVEIAAAARDAGWDVVESEFVGYGDKTIGSIHAQITIAGLVSDDVVWFDLNTRD